MLGAGVNNFAFEESGSEYGGCSRYVVKPINAEKEAVESSWKVEVVQEDG